MPEENTDKKGRGMASFGSAQTGFDFSKGFRDRDARMQTLRETQAENEKINKGLTDIFDVASKVPEIEGDAPPTREQELAVKTSQEAMDRLEQVTSLPLAQKKSLLGKLLEQEFVPDIVSATDKLAQLKLDEIEASKKGTVKINNIIQTVVPSDENGNPTQGDAKEVTDESLIEESKEALTLTADDPEPPQFIKKRNQFGGFDTVTNPNHAIWVDKQKGKTKLILKQEEARQADLIKSQKTANGTYRFLQQYSRSRQELIAFDPEVEKEGLTGYINRKKASIAEHFDELPETRALTIQIKPMANKMARDIEGGRVTDQDRQIYADSFANALENPGTTNTRLASQSIVALIDNGGNVVPMLIQLSNANDSVMNGIISQVIEQFPDMVTQIYGEDVEVVND